MFLPMTDASYVNDIATPLCRRFHHHFCSSHPWQPQSDATSEFHDPRRVPLQFILDLIPVGLTLRMYVGYLSESVNTVSFKDLPDVYHQP